MLRWSIRIVVALIVATVVLYLADSIVLQVRERRGTAHRTIMVDSAEVVKEKGGKVEYYFSAPQPTPCVRALFPHAGEDACWWLARHAEQQQFMN